ncbi:hypothetical protein PGT21_032973 [Puccinia graminis f. sp. tritici]|uniref:Uncharacterized protein n=2 Tax=Puccinia graminis f. sp. tritici TaxID=56615 RepID=E3JXS2_PUCGT|nr:uncharacterized protein PGTG_02308 [Puccinia graminis f. sp. tritici CRL 75-36-700-3]EFP76847.2 hypothetical protein PGTG_02308 [Puccinia graminis f. sp. tritici CRL 75-36-700-3]KAA1065234.1 hypothetical protein PGTUg99_007692 [Puccinia graminis f. sp. tritici]KAA1094932.1 hypothetical protein PGT21_032973 [Puccinia graminis f. sp. tritici]KAA1135440.1 hypothetical protein PGTUg99_025242 [Puccinia graminis f. sp. tritici]
MITTVISSSPLSTPVQSPSLPSHSTGFLTMASPHTPPVSSPLAHSGRRPANAIRFGATGCTPKQCILINLSMARQAPYLTRSASHQYRFTSKGMKLFAVKGTNFHIEVVYEEAGDDDSN